MKNTERKLKTSSIVPTMDFICTKCNGTCFSENGTKRQRDVLQKFGGLPSDCVDSSIDGHKCPFITESAYERGNHTHVIPQHGDGYYKTPTIYERI